jgi:hypothetical protein
VRCCDRHRPKPDARMLPRSSNLSAYQGRRRQSCARRYGISRHMRQSPRLVHPQSQGRQSQGRQAVRFKRAGRQHPTAGPFGRGCELPIHSRPNSSRLMLEYGCSLECRNMWRSRARLCKSLHGQEFQEPARGPRLRLLLELKERFLSRSRRGQ